MAILDMLSNDDKDKHLCTDPKRMDIICGRSTRETESHPGNTWFRMLIQQHKSSYCNNPCFEKSKVVEEILSEIESRGGRFVQKMVLFPDGTMRPSLERDEDLHARGGNLLVYVQASKKLTTDKIRRALRRRDKTPRNR
mmetsp:Transcript_21659/g.36887  ORF Transcript_21659/g.36887 Transcript_21659/m.36887 type:complete len:139 (-) Transcript_21659:1943-2359(-)